MNRTSPILFAAFLAGLAVCLLAEPGLSAGSPDESTPEGEVPEDAIAVVNGRPVPRKQFFRSLARTMGEAAIDSFLDRVLVRQAAQARGIEVTRQEVEERRELEIRLRMHRLYEQARMTPEEFRRAARSYGWEEGRARKEIAAGITPAAMRLQLMLEKLLAPEIEISERDLRSHYRWTRGPRLAGAHIMVESSEKAEEVLEELRDSPEAWREMVQKHSVDRPSVPYAGRMQPVPAETSMGRALAQVKPGEARIYSDGENHHVLRLIRRIPAQGPPFEEIRQKLRREVLARRAGEQADALLARLRREATIVTNVAATERKRRLLGPDVVAYVNGRPVHVVEFGRVLLEQFGAPLLQPFIERQLIFQQAEQKDVQVSPEALEKRRRELAEAILARRKRQAGREEFHRSLEENAISEQQYGEKLAEEQVSPAEVRALLLAEKMVTPDVSITSEDLRDAYDRHYGERIEVRQLAARTQAEAVDLRRRAQSGVSFRLLMQTQSAGALSWAQDALVRNITPDHPFYPYVRKLPPGRISPILNHGSRFYLLEVIGRHKPEDPPPLESVREELEELAGKEKIRSRIQAWLHKLKAESRVQILRDVGS